MPITLEHATDKAYATDANSRILPKWAQKTLKAAAAGREVCAWDLHAALDQALSACATRNGQSMGRREDTRKVRHLIYKCDAVIENHLAGLAPMEPGARSPKIARLEQEIADNHAQAVAEGAKLQGRISDLIREKTDLEIALDSLTTASLQTTSRLGEAESANADLAEEVDRLTMFLRHESESWERLHALYIEQVKTLEYARSLLDQIGRAKVEGYIEGAREAR